MIIIFGKDHCARPFRVRRTKKQTRKNAIFFYSKDGNLPRSSAHMCTAAAHDVLAVCIFLKTRFGYLLETT